MYSRVYKHTHTHHPNTRKNRDYTWFYHQVKDKTEPNWKKTEEYHLAYNIDFEEGDQETFISRRPDGLAFDKEKVCVSLECTRAMNTSEVKIAFIIARKEIM